MRVGIVAILHSVIVAMRVVSKLFMSYRAFHMNPGAHSLVQLCSDERLSPLKQVSVIQRRLEGGNVTEILDSFRVMGRNVKGFLE